MASGFLIELGNAEQDKFVWDLGTGAYLNLWATGVPMSKLTKVKRGGGRGRGAVTAAIVNLGMVNAISTAATAQCILYPTAHPRAKKKSLNTSNGVHSVPLPAHAAARAPVHHHPGYRCS